MAGSGHWGQMTAGFNCEITLGGVAAHHSSKNVAQLNHLAFIHFMYIEFYNPSLRNYISYTSLHLHNLSLFTRMSIPSPVLIQWVLQVVIVHKWWWAMTRSLFSVWILSFYIIKLWNILMDVNILVACINTCWLVLW